MLRATTLAALSAAVLACSNPPPAPARPPMGQVPSATTSAQPEWIPFSIRAGKPVQADPRERHLTDVRQLTVGDGENAEAYWSPDGKKLIFQSTREGRACDQIYTMDLGSGEVKRVSTGGARTTCAYFAYPSGNEIIYSSTLAAGADCPPKPDRSLGYVWALDPFQIYAARADGSERRLLVGGKGYTAETTVAYDGKRMVFTSTRDGDLELYTSKVDGTDIKRITNTPGYDGGAFFSPNGAKLVWRASRPKGADLEEYNALLAKGLVRPTALEIFVSGAEGQNARAVTKNGKANFAPSYLPDSRRVIFASNVDSPPGHGRAPNFELYVVDPEGTPGADGMTPLERITFYEGFDGFPLFSPSGEYLVFASNRFGSKPGETNIFVAKWVE